MTSGSLVRDGSTRLLPRRQRRDGEAGVLQHVAGQLEVAGVVLDEEDDGRLAHDVHLALPARRRSGRQRRQPARRAS